MNDQSDVGLIRLTGERSFPDGCVVKHEEAAPFKRGHTHKSLGELLAAFAFGLQRPSPYSFVAVIRSFCAKCESLDESDDVECFALLGALVEMLSSNASAKLDYDEAIRDIVYTLQGLANKWKARAGLV